MLIYFSTACEKNLWCESTSRPQVIISSWWGLSLVRLLRSPPPGAAASAPCCRRRMWECHKALGQRGAVGVTLLSAWLNTAKVLWRSRCPDSKPPLALLPLDLCISSLALNSSLDGCWPLLFLAPPPREPLLSLLYREAKMSDGSWRRHHQRFHHDDATKQFTQRRI